MYFATDIDLLPWEPSLFLNPAFLHQALIKNAPGTLTTTSLVMNAPVLADILPNMVAAITLADDSFTQLLEITALADATHATVSALRGSASESPLPPLVGGAVKVTIITFRPQLAAVGDQLLAQLGITSDRTITDPTPAHSDLVNFHHATIFTTLFTLYRTLVDLPDSTPLTLAKKTFYDSMSKTARRHLSATIDTNNDNTPDTIVRTDTPTLTRV